MTTICIAPDNDLPVSQVHAGHGAACTCKWMVSMPCLWICKTVTSCWLQLILHVMS